VEALEVTAAALNMVVAVAVVHAQTLHKRAWVVVALVLAVLVAVVVECQMVSRVARVARQDLTQQAAAQQGGQVLQGLRARMQRVLVVVLVESLGLFQDGV
jgi:hypothetical protein